MRLLYPRVSRRHTLFSIRSATASRGELQRPLTVTLACWQYALQPAANPCAPQTVKKRRRACAAPLRNAARLAALAGGLTRLENSTHRPARASVALRNVNTLHARRQHIEPQMEKPCVTLHSQDIQISCGWSSVSQQQQWQRHALDGTTFQYRSNIDL